MENELFKPIRGYEGLYDISETGKVYSHKSKRTLKRCGDEYGFYIVKLYKDGNESSHNVFKLMERSILFFVY
ncbi:MAG: NUMOD4 domain-containing protein [Bacillota bacterium]